MRSSKIAIVRMLSNSEDFVPKSEVNKRQLLCELVVVHKVVTAILIVQLNLKTVVLRE